MAEMDTEKKEEIYHFLKLLEKDKAQRLVLSATQKMRDAMDDHEEKNKPLSDKARIIKEKCISYGPPGIRLADIFSEILEEDIRIPSGEKTIPYIPMAGLIVKEKFDGHNYTVGSIVIIFSNEKRGSGQDDLIRCIKENGLLGNNLRTVAKMYAIPSDNDLIKYIDRVFSE